MESKILKNIPEKLSLILFLFFTILAGRSNLEVKNVQLDPTGIVTKRDANGEYCAAIKIISEMNGFKYTSYNGIVDVEHKPGQDLVYLSANERVLKIFLAGYQPKKIILSEYGIDLQTKKIWEIEITGDKQPPQIPVNIITQPENVNIFIDGQKINANHSVKISKGQHSLKLTKKGYENIDTSISVNDTSTLFEYELSSLSPVKTTIKSKPEHAVLYINGLKEGYTNKQIYLLPGQYQVQLNKNGYKIRKDSIAIKSNAKNEFLYQLKQISSRLIINTTPSSAEVYLNNTRQTTDTLIVSPGKYKIFVEAKNYYSSSRIIEVREKEERNVRFKLEPKSGGLSVQVKPIDSQIMLKRQGRVVDSWRGAKRINNLKIGTYQLFCNTYKNKNRIINVNVRENKTTTLNLNLKNIPVDSLHSTSDYSQFVYLKGDTFNMGDIWGRGNSNEKPAHKVRVDGFYISKYEVTHAEYIKFLNDANIPRNGRYKGKTLINLNKSWSAIEYKDEQFVFKKSKYAPKINCPVIGVTFYGACFYGNWKSQLEGFEPVYNINNTVVCDWDANGYRLPTEAEWEYAARSGGKAVKYSGTHKRTKLNEFAWYKNNSQSKVHPVGEKQFNSKGLYDMNGNVFEWCWDWYEIDYYSYSPFKNPIGPQTGEGRILRGGSWRTPAYYCRNTNRYLNNPGYSRPDNGFRLVRDPKED